MLTEIPSDWFICPISHEPLKQLGQTMTSTVGSYQFDNKNKFWDFTPVNLKELQDKKWATWNHLQENGVASYLSSPTNNLGVGPRQDFMDFMAFCQMNGRILDVGVGPQKNPSHFQYASAESKKEFVGLDPLTGDCPRDFMFVKGLGEFLPFRNNFFDQILFVTSLDHFIDPSAPLREAKRAMKKSGEICIWLGEKDKNAPKPKTSPDWYTRLTIPEGAEDRFHYKRFSLNEFMIILKNLDLKITEHESIKIDEWRTNHFIKLAK
ncbi:class I SAM-dependent methyltransferase [bacterium]|nr:class I SAM-dependent methyltransferase [bacterium]